MTEVVKDGSAWAVDAEIALEVGCHEALVRQAYRDSVGVWTWCVGMTDATGHLVERYIDNPQTVAYCMKLYAWALDNYADGVRRAFRGVKITKAQFAAALSFHWNTGAIETAAWVKHFRNGDVSRARKAIMNWTTPKSLTERRKEERALFFDGIWANDGTMVEYTRLKADYTPDWSSARHIGVAMALHAAFKKVEAPKLDQRPKPDNVPAAPTLTPDKGTVPPQKPVSAQTPSPAPERQKEQERPSAVPDRGFWGAAIALAVSGAATLAYSAWEWLSSLPCSYLNLFCGG